MPQYWIIYLVEATVEVYAEPRSGRAAAYRGQRIYGIRESLPLVLGDREVRKIAVSERLPSLR